MPVNTTTSSRLGPTAATALIAVMILGLEASRSQETADGEAPTSEPSVVASPYPLEMTGVIATEWVPITVDAPHAFEMNGLGAIANWDTVAADSPFAMEMTGLGEIEPWESIVVDSPFALEMTGSGDG